MGFLNMAEAGVRTTCMLKRVCMYCVRAQLWFSGGAVQGLAAGPAWVPGFPNRSSLLHRDLTEGCTMV